MSVIAEPRWLQLISPATACLRFGVLLVVAMAQVFGLTTRPEVLFVGAGVGVVYVLMYAAAAFGKIRPAALAYSAIADGVLLGILLSGVASAQGVVAPLLFPVLAVAQMSGGALLTLLVVAGAAAAWGVGTLTGTPVLVWPAVTAPAHFKTFLQAETTFRGATVSLGSVLPIEVVALSMLFLISIAGAIALIRAARERRRAVETCLHAEALEAIVDHFLTQAPAEEFWRVVAEAGAAITGGRVYVARAENGRVTLRSTGGPVPGTELDQTAEWILRNIRVPMSQENNMIVRSIRHKTEEEACDVSALCSGSERSVSSDVLEKLRDTWRAAFVCVPIGDPEGMGALVGIAPRITEPIRTGLRAVAARVELVMRAWQNEPEPPLTPVPKDVPA